MMLLLSGIAISFFLTALLLFKKKKNGADKLLLAWFVLIIMTLLLSYFDSLGNIRNRYSFLAGINLPFPLLHAPLFFLYVSALTRTFPKKVFALAHFLPAIGCYVFLIPFFLLPAQEKIYILDHQGASYENFVLLKFAATIASGIVYVAWSLYKINKHQKKIINAFSDIEKINLSWLRMLTYGIGILWIVVAFGTDARINICIALFVATIGLFGIRQTGNFTDFHTAVSVPPQAMYFNNTPIINENKIKYGNSGLSSERKSELEKALIRLMDIEKIYLKAELSIDQIASELGLHANYVSQYINEELGLTFYDYVNSKRVEEFKRIVNLPENKNFNLLGVSYDCGFNSKSSFNRNFKKFTGQTPTAYLRGIQAAEN